MIQGERQAVSILSRPKLWQAPCRSSQIAVVASVIVILLGLYSGAVETALVAMA